MKKKDEIIRFIKEGNSINKIRKMTGCAKSTIYYHYKKIKGRKKKPVEISFEKERELGEFLGIFAGDGSFTLGKNSHYKIRIHLGFYEKEYADFLVKQLTTWFNKKPHIYYKKYQNKDSSIDLHYDSKLIYNFLKEHLVWEGRKTYTVRLKKLDLRKREFNLGFLRGLIDTDGNYYAPKRRISFSSTSKLLADQAEKIICSNVYLDPNRYLIKSEKYADLHTLTLHGEKAKKLIDAIKPNNINKTIR